MVTFMYIDTLYGMVTFMYIDTLYVLHLLILVSVQ